MIPIRNFTLCSQGSSLLEIDHSIGDLSRRVSMHTLPGLSFREFLMFERYDIPQRLDLSDVLFSHEKIAASISSVIDVLPMFRKYMEKGYYPFYKSMKTDDYYSRLVQSVSTVIEYDIPAVEKKLNMRL